MTPPNVVIFGETGAGKSSLVNLVVGKDVAPISSQAIGCTSNSSHYTTSINGMDFHLHDTTGLGEGGQGTVAKYQALDQLYTLLHTLDSGLNLLIFCMRAPRITESCIQNWRIVYDVFCQKHVPIILAITGLENEENLDLWWNQNAQQFEAYDIYPSAVACVIATRGRRQGEGCHVFDDEYEESQVKMRKVIQTTHLVDPWKIPGREWARVVYDREGFKFQLRSNCLMSEGEADALVRVLDKQVCLRMETYLARYPPLTRALMLVSICLETTWRHAY